MLTAAKRGARVLVVMALVVATLTLVRPRPAAAASVWFNGYGDQTHATFGPNASVTIYGDLAGGCPDAFGRYTANVYVVAHGLDDPNVPGEFTDQEPNAVITSDANQGLFVSEVVGFTVPSGKIAAGDYDIVLNVCADGFYVPGRDIIAGADAPHGAFTVEIPANVPLLPSADILAIKKSAGSEANHWLTTKKDLKSLFDWVGVLGDITKLSPGQAAGEIVKDALKKVGIQTACDWFAGLPPAEQTQLRYRLLKSKCDPLLEKIKKNTSFPDYFLDQLKEASLKQLAVQVAANQAIAADPPDPAFDQLVTLGSVDWATAESSNSIESAGVNLDNQVAEEAASLNAVLASMQKYEGAQQAGDGQDALLQARSLQQYATLAAGFLSNVDNGLDGLSAAFAPISDTLSAAAGAAAGLRQQVVASGLSPDQLAAFSGMGFSGDDIALLESVLTQHYDGTPQTDTALDGYLGVASFDSVRGDIESDDAAFASGLRQLALDLAPIIADLASQVPNTTLPSVSAGGPYTGGVGSPIAFSATATAPRGAGVLSAEWDLTGDGTFTDASGLNPTFTFTSPRHGLVGVRVTDAAGSQAVSYATLDVTGSAPAPQIVSLSSSSPSPIQAGASTDFSATVTDAGGGSPTYQWSLDGVLVGNALTYSRTWGPLDIGPHVVGLTVQDSGRSTSATTLVLIVAPVDLASIQVTPGRARLGPHESAPLVAIGMFSDGLSADLTRQATWSSSSTGVATVDATGTVTGQGPGNASIAAAAAGVTGEAEVFVPDQSGTTLTSLSVTPISPTLDPGHSVQFHATGVYSDGTSKDLTSSVEWESDGSSVVSVSPAGLVQAQTTGAATVFAISDDQIVGDAIYVPGPSARSLDSITVSPPTSSLSTGMTVALQATGHYSDGSTQNLSSTATWSSSDSSIATVVTGGLTSATGTGSASITATVGGVSGSAQVSVGGPGAPTLTSLTLTPATASAPAGTTVTFTATGQYSDGTTRNLTSTAHWATSNPMVASVTTGGQVSALHGGVAMITATMDGVTSASPLTVTVTLQSIMVKPANQLIAVGQDQQYQAIGTYSDSTVSDVTSAVAWSSSASGVATVSAQGTVHGVANGTSTITATRGTVTGSTSVVIMQAVPDPNVKLFYVTQAPNPGIARVTVDANGNATVQNYWTRFGLGSGPDSVVFDHQGNLLASQPNQGWLTRVAAGGGVLAYGFNKVNLPDITDLAMDPNSDTVFAIQWSHTAQANDVWKISTTDGTTTPLGPASGVPHNLGGIALTPDGHRLFVASHDGTLDERDPVSGNVVREITVGGFLDGLTYDPVTDHLFVSTCGPNHNQLCEVGIGTSAQPGLTLLNTYNVASDGIAADGQGHVFLIQNVCCLLRLDLTSGQVTPVASNLAGADDVAPVVGTGAPAGSSVPVGTILAYTGDASGDNHDPARLAARLTEKVSGASVVAAPITLAVGSQRCAAFTGADGTASCTVVPDQPAGSVEATASFAGSSTDLPATASAPFALNLEETALSVSVSPMPLVRGQMAMVSATLTEDQSPALVGQSITFTLGTGAGAQQCSATTLADGVGTCSLPSVSQPAGPTTLQANFAATERFRAAAAAASPTVVIPTQAVVGGDAGGEYHDDAHLGAHLVDLSTAPPSPIPGAILTLGAGSATCTATTAADGGVSCVANPNDPPGTTTATAVYAGDGTHLPSTGSGPFALSREQTAVFSQTRPFFTAPGAATLAGVLLEDDSIPLAGRAVDLSLGSGARRLSCAATTAADGTVSCAVDTTAVNAGSQPVALSFAGDAFFAPSNGAGTTNIQVATTTSLTCTPDPATEGQSSTCTATVASPPGAASATGGVVLATANAGTLDPTTCTLDATGVCTTRYRPAFRSAGTHALSARYVGDLGHLASSGTLRLPVLDAPLTATGRSFATPNPLTTATIMTFVDADPTGTPPDYTATITWGDGTPATTGVVTQTGPGAFAVAGSHKYPPLGPFTRTVSVRVCDFAGSCADATSTVRLLYMTGRAEGLSAVIAPGLLPPLQPTIADTGEIATTDASDHRTAALTVPAGPVSATVLPSEVRTATGPASSVAESDVADVRIAVPGLPLIVIRGLVTSSTTTCTGSSGNTTIAGLTVGTTNVPVGSTAIVANRYLTLGPATLVINEQSAVPGGLQVNGLHVRLAGIADIVVGSARSDIHNCR